MSWSIKRKLSGLCSALIGLTVMVGAVEMVGGKLVMDSLEDIANVQLPAVRNMTLADMMHDGLRAVAFRSILVAEHGDDEQRKEVAEELKEMSENFLKYIAAIDQLDVQAETKSAIESAKPGIATYVKSTEEVVGLALAGQRDQAIKRLPEFQKSFSALEEKLETLGELIEKDAGRSREAGASIAMKVKVVSGILIVVGALVGLWLSVWIVRNLMSTLMTAIEQLSSSSYELSAAAEQTAASATELSGASTQQAASLQQTMASVEEISAMVSQNAESASKVKTVVEANQVASTEGSKSMGNMLEAIEHIKDSNDRILSQMELGNKEFGEIVKIISEIGDKTKVINDIVFQTKLLSFNASVEAARAGEHGKGFAVVAEEVGNLAQMSGNAAKEISDMLANSIKKVNEIVEQTTNRVDQLGEIGKDKIVMGQSAASKCAESLNKMTENAQAVAVMVAEIAHASKEQAQGIQEINKAISQLDQVTQQNSSVAQQSSSQAEQLNVEASSLAATVRVLAKFASGKSSETDLSRGIQASSKSESLNGDNVVALSRSRKTGTRIKAKRSPPQSQAGALNNGGGRVAVGHEVPSSGDPNFEEF